MIQFFSWISKLKTRRPKPADRGGGRRFCKKKIRMSPNDLFFFPVKLELNPDLMKEISTGNTSEISTSRSRKSVILVNFGPKNPDFDPEICCRQKFLRVPNFQKSKSMALQHHFALSSSFIIPKAENLVSDKVDEKSNFWRRFLEFENLNFEVRLLIFRQLRQTLDFRLLELWS